MQSIINTIGLSGYKSFSKDSFFQINMAPSVTVFIGKNNGGKSTCLDIIESVFAPGYFNRQKVNFSRVALSFALNDAQISTGFLTSHGGGDVPYRPPHGMHYDYGKEFVGKEIFGDLKASSNDNPPTLVLAEENPNIELPHSKAEWQRVIQCFQNYLQTLLLYLLT